MESSSIDIDKYRIVSAFNAATAEVAQFVDSTKSPTLLHTEESKKQYRSVLDNFKAFDQLPGEEKYAELKKVLNIGAQWQDYDDQRGKDALAREDDKYFNDLIHRSKQSLERVCAFLDSLLRPITEPEARHQHPASPQDSVDNEHPPLFETQGQSEVHQESEPVHNESGPCAPTPGPSQSPVSSKRRFVTALDETPTPILGPTIDFQEVYQDGNGLLRYIIIDREHTLSTNPTVSGQWWILRCVKCNWHGVNKTVRTLYDGSVHAEKCFPQLKITGDASVIDALGVLVLNCNQDLFSKNNDEVKQALVDKSYEPAYRKRNKRSKLMKVTVPTRESNEPPIITDPSVGILYLAHGRDSAIFGAIVLPLGDFRSRVGIRGSIYDPESSKALPDCYRFHPGQRKFFWAEGYEDGGGNVTMRKFPVFYLDGPSVAMGHVRWASAVDLELFNLAKVAPGYDKPVQEYTKYYQCSNGIKPFSCELSKEELPLVNSGHGQSSRVVNGDRESNRPTNPTSEPPIVIEDDEVSNHGPDTSLPEAEQIPFDSSPSTQAPAHPTNLDPHKQIDGEANGSDTSAPNISDAERFPSPHFYIPPEIDMNEAAPQQEQTVPPVYKAPEASMDLGSRASAMTSPVANRSAAATISPSATSSRPKVQEHDHNTEHSHYQFAAESSQYSLSTSDISAIHGLWTKFNEKS